MHSMRQVVAGAQNNVSVYRLQAQNLKKEIRQLRSTRNIDFEEKLNTVL
jgi:hypothetical protein